MKEGAIPTGLVEIKRITRKYYDILEAEIRETPHNWLWTHKRWK